MSYVLASVDDMECHRHRGPHAQPPVPATDQACWLHPHVIAAGGTGPVQLAGEPWVRRRKLIAPTQYASSSADR